LNPYNSVVWKSDHPKEGFYHWWRKNEERERKGKAINHPYRDSLCGSNLMGDCNLSNIL